MNGRRENALIEQEMARTDRRKRHETFLVSTLI